MGRCGIIEDRTDGVKASGCTLLVFLFGRALVPVAVMGKLCKDFDL